MKKFLYFIIILFIVLFVALSSYYIGINTQLIPKSETIITKKPEKPLEKYTIENLSGYNISQGNFEITEVLEEKDKYNSYLFSLEFDPTLQGNPKNYKKTTGQINIPKEEHPVPVIIMIRGYVDQTLYQTGIGTRKAAEVFANNGYITIAPDFFGYAGSDSEASNIFETRFQTYTTILTLLQSLNQLNIPEELTDNTDHAFWDNKNIFFWGHSNGGQIALTVLEVTESNYPTTLWAPVSKSFPYSILYFTDESEDKGRLIRRELSKFEDLYDVDDFSIHKYLERIKAPIQLHQGTADGAVPVSWSDNLAKKLKSLEVDLTYYKYSGADHNMRPSWDVVVSRDLDFFKKHQLTTTE
jgi:dienelactone hydrolase